MAKSDERQVRCNFCGKRQSEVERLIAGTGALIWGACKLIAKFKGKK